MGCHSPPGRQPRLFFLRIADARSLQHYYLDWAESGGVFIPTPMISFLGENVFIILCLAGERHAVGARVVWINPHNSLGDRPSGIGVQFIEAAVGLQNTVEKLLSKASTEPKLVPGPTI